jgi:RNA polymerase sigma-70 factor (ECF subfamily)
MRLSRLLDRAAAGDPDACGELFARHRDRLRRLIQYRLDWKLRGRLDPSDVLQETYLDFVRALPSYVEKPHTPFFVWLRFIADRKLLVLHRHHLGTGMRAAGREISLDGRVSVAASSMTLAARIVGKFSTPSQAAMRAELRRIVREALDSMEPLDREVLSLRHFEQLSNSETAAVLGISQTAATNRFVRALDRLRAILEKLRGLIDDADSAGGTPQ